MPKKQLNPELEINLEKLAEQIELVSDAFVKINASRLCRRTIVLLLQDAIGSSKIGKQHIELMLDYAPKLKQLYLKKESEK